MREYLEQLSIQQAADVLNVSPSYFVRLLEEQKIPFIEAGTNRQVRLADVVEYMRRDDQERKAAADELTVLTQELGFDR